MTKPVRPVTLLIAGYQAAWCIDDCLASIAAGTHLPEEVVVVDDGSTDGTATAASAWTSRLLLRVIELDRNQGVAAARNAGLATITTPLTAILDADDVILPDHVRLIVDAHEQHGGIITPNAFYWLADGRLTNYRGRLRRTKVPGEHQLAELLRRNFVFIASLTESKLLREIGGFRGFPGTAPLPDSPVPPLGARGILEDWDMWLRLVATGHRITAVDTPTVLYRVGGTSLGSDERKLSYASLHLLRAFAAEHPGLSSEAVERARLGIEARLKVVDLQDRCRTDQRRASPAEAARTLTKDPRLMVRTLALGLLPPAKAQHLLGNRGAW